MYVCTSTNCQCNRNWYMQTIMEFTLQLKYVSDNLFLTAAVAAFPLLLFYFSLIS